MFTGSKMLNFFSEVAVMRTGASVRNWTQASPNGENPMEHVDLTL
jgi:hypothetical protein